MKTYYLMSLDFIKWKVVETAGGDGWIELWMYLIQMNCTLRKC
jgi:hypothetical protein